MLTSAGTLLLLTLAASSDAGVEVRAAIGDLHGFPSMSDASGDVIATGELRQERRGRHLVVRATWRFRDGRVAEERDTKDDPRVVIDVIPRAAVPQARTGRSR